MVCRTDGGLPRRRALGVLAGAALLGALGSCGAGASLGEDALDTSRGDAGRRGPDLRGLDDALDALVDGIDPDGPYRPPTPAEFGRVGSAVDLLLAGDARAADAFAALGMATNRVTDPATGRRYALAAGTPDTERAWGLLAVDLTPGPDLLIEVPHPVSDQNTERIGLDLLRAVPGAALVVAGAHRRADDGRADVAHRTDSLFHAVAVRLAARGFAQLQLHGFHDDSLPGEDVVVSPGAGPESAQARDAADRLDDTGFDVCRAWNRDCGSLEGRRNVQGVEAARLGRPFVHLETNKSVRDDRERRAEMVGALAGPYRT